MQIGGDSPAFRVVMEVLGIARRLFHTGLVTTVCVKSRIAQFSLTNHMELAGA